MKAIKVTIAGKETKSDYPYQVTAHDKKIK